MDKHKLMVAGGIGGAGLLAVIVLKRRAAASAAASAQTGTTSGNIDLGSLSSLSPASTGVSTGGTYAVDLSGGTSGDTTTPSLDTTASVASFAQLLQGILSSGATATAAAQSAAAANNTQATNAITAAAPTTPAPAAAPTVTYQGPRNLVSNVGGYLVSNPGLYATDSNYRQAWDAVSGANSSAFGDKWNSAGKGASEADLTTEITNYYHNTYGT